MILQGDPGLMEGWRGGACPRARGERGVAAILMEGSETRGAKKEGDEWGRTRRGTYGANVTEVFVHDF